MDMNHELARELISIAATPSETPLEERMAALLSQYHITKKQTGDPADLQRHVQHFLAAKRIEGLSPKTLKNYALYLGHLVSYVHCDIHDITTDDIRGFLASRRVCPASLLTITNILRSFFNWLTVEEIITKNPMLKVRTQRRRTAALPKSLGVEGLEQLRNACDNPRERALLEVLYATGCRVSEVAHLRLSDVDWSAHTMRVLGKGGKERTVCFSIRTKLLLEEYLRRRPGHSDALFCNTRAPYTAMCCRMIQRTIHDLGVRASQPERVYPHRLRHTFATLALNRGMDITAIQYLLGHAQLSTTEIYARVDQGSIHQAYDRVVA